MAKGRHTPRRRTRRALFVGAAVAVLVLAAGGAAYSAYRYEMANADRILPGVRIDGVDVGGMTRAEAVAALQEEVTDRLDSPISLVLGEEIWTSSVAELGRKALVERAVGAALAVNQQHSTFDRFWARFRDTPVDVDLEIAYETRGKAAQRLVDDIADEVYRPGRDASVAIDDSGDGVRFIRGQDGTKLARAAALRRLLAAVDHGRPTVELGTVAVAPKVTAGSLGPTIVVHVDRNELELYDGFDLVRTYDVATAKPGYTTPDGEWTIWDKRENPTWYNPALDDWGAGLPAVIPGGPGNPMGTRALYIDAPGLIRIHGTTDPSSIGRYASHGCIRMQNEEIEDLFDRVPVGTKVLVVGSRPANAGYWDTPAAADI